MGVFLLPSIRDTGGGAREASVKVVVSVKSFFFSSMIKSLTFVNPPVPPRTHEYPLGPSLCPVLSVPRHRRDELWETWRGGRTATGGLLAGWGRIG